MMMTEMNLEPVKKSVNVLYTVYFTVSLNLYG